MTIIRSDIISRIKQNTHLDKKRASEVTDLIFEIMKSTLANGDSIQIKGFGTFSVRKKAARTGRNPKTKQEYPIKARKVVTYYPSKTFRKPLNEAP
jgi:nucleoid DNA-binding protein